MKLTTLLPIAAAGSGLFLSGTASAQVMTELRISTSGADEEYAEIQGTPGATTDGLFICNVEGDPGGSGGGVGTLDRIHDLGGNTFGTDGFFVVGSTEAQANATFGGEIDLSLGPNMFENSSGTFYLVRVTDMNALATLNSNLNMDIRTAMGASTTILTTTPGIEVLDIVAMWDGDAGDMFLDGAPVFGPDGSFLPAGIFRPGGCPNDWCTDVFIEFDIDGSVGAGYVLPSPGAVNEVVGCVTASSIGACPGTTGSIGTPYCMVNANSTGVEAVLEANGSTTVANNDVTLVASSLPANQFGFFLNSDTTGFAANIGTNGAGNLCLGGVIGRYNGPGQILNAGPAGEFELALDLNAIPRGSMLQSAMAGDTWYFQAWFRDINVLGPSSNLTNGLEITFQ